MKWMEWKVPLSCLLCYLTASILIGIYLYGDNGSLFFLLILAAIPILIFYYLLTDLLLQSIKLLSFAKDSPSLRLLHISLFIPLINLVMLQLAFSFVMLLIYKKITNVNQRIRASFMATLLVCCLFIAPFYLSETVTSIFLFIIFYNLSHLNSNAALVLLQDIQLFCLWLYSIFPLYLIFTNDLSAMLPFWGVFVSCIALFLSRSLYTFVYEFKTSMMRR